MSGISQDMKRFLVSIRAKDIIELREHLVQAFESDTPHKWTIVGEHHGQGALLSEDGPAEYEVHSQHARITEDDRFPEFPGYSEFSLRRDAFEEARYRVKRKHVGVIVYRIVAIHEREWAKAKPKKKRTVSESQTIREAMEKKHKADDRRAMRNARKARRAEAKAKS